MEQDDIIVTVLDTAEHIIVHSHCNHRFGCIQPALL
jgi:hypothetical protein